MNLDEYTQDQFQEALSSTLGTLLSNPLVKTHEQPSAVLLGGQSGAGKSTLHRIYKAQYNNDVVVINGDEYRKSHPNFDLIQSHFGMDAPSHTAKWSGAMTEALVNALSQQQYNLVVEGTLRTSSVPKTTARLLRSRGYAVSLAIMAVKPEISLISCQIRYEEMRIAGTTPRATDPAHHRKIVDEIAGNLADLEASGLFDEVRLYDRAGTCRFPAPDARQTASKTLSVILFGPWTPEERGHYEHLQSRLNALQAA